MILQVWDNGGKSFDQYTVRIGNAYYGMSDNARSPQGFNQFIGEYPEIDETKCGQKITKREYRNLPMEVRQAIMNRS